MKSFLKYVSASVTGIIVFLILVMAVFSVIFAISYVSGTYKLEDHTILALNLNGRLKDKVTPNPVMQYLGLEEADEISLTDMVSSIRKAKENEKIDGIYLNCGMFSASNALLLELRNELLDFKESGKFIIAYGGTYTQNCYFLASLADKVILNPTGVLDLHGLVSQPMYYKGLFDKLGIEMQVFKVGTFKSAVEPYIMDKMSDANRLQVSSYVNDIWGTILNGISKSRNIPVAELDSIADTFPLFKNPEEIIAKGLADTLMYETDVKQMLATMTGKQKVKDLKLASVGNLKSVELKNKPKGSAVIAVLYAEGSIVSGNSNDDINDRYYIRQIEKLKNDKDTKAVVLRVNSPGGSAYASEQIWKAVTDLKTVKPVVVSMGGYAASGGYYISCNASKIIAQPSTLTGSIGIFGIFPNVEGLVNKIGISFDNVKTNKFSDFGDITRPMRDDEKEMLQTYIDKGYDLFLTRCSEGRAIPKDSLSKIAEGRVWTGNQALEIGLVDALGGIDMAIEEAAKIAGYNEYSIKRYPRQKDFFEELLSDKKQEIAVNAMKAYFGEDYSLIKTIKEIKEMKEQDFIQARLPYDFAIE